MMEARASAPPVGARRCCCCCQPSVQAADGGSSTTRWPRFLQLPDQAPGMRLVIPPGQAVRTEFAIRLVTAEHEVRRDDDRVRDRQLRSLGAAARGDALVL